MAVNADDVAGFAGDVDEDEFAQLVDTPATYRVLGESHLAVTLLSGGADRTARVAAGTAYGRGVLARFDTTTDLQCAVVASGFRWDTIVVRRDRDDSSAQLVVLQGTTAQAISSSRRVSWTTGNNDDQPIALVKVVAGASTLADMVDLRAWAGNGGMHALSTLALGYLAEVGASVMIGSTLWRRTIDAAGVAAWAPVPLGVANTDWVTPAQWGLDFGEFSTLRSRVWDGHIELAGRLQRSSGAMTAGELPLISTTPHVAAAACRLAHTPSVERKTGGGIAEVYNGTYYEDHAGVQVRVATSGNVYTYLDRGATRVCLDGLRIPL